MTVLADTSIWVDYLRGGRRSKAGRLDELLTASEVVVCGPVLAELLAGAKATDRTKLRLLLTGLPWAVLGPLQWQNVGEVAARLRERGESVALTDIEIAVAAVDATSRLWTRDEDFSRIRLVLTDLQLFAP
ncbi:MAG: PIN domain-containing protein [Candidatus Dormibacteria bacterium]